MTAERQGLEEQLTAHATNTVENFVVARENVETVLLEGQQAQEEADEIARDVIQLNLITIKN